MGPGVATFLCGAESFPTPIRGHFLGLAAAVGKAGAAIGTQVSVIVDPVCPKLIAVRFLLPFKVPLTTSLKVFKLSS